jgi:hypothetical protein
MNTDALEDVFQEFADSADGSQERAGDLGIAVPLRYRVENLPSLGVSRGVFLSAALGVPVDLLEVRPEQLRQEFLPVAEIGPAVAPEQQAPGLPGRLRRAIDMECLRPCGPKTSANSGCCWSSLGLYIWDK